MSDYETWQDRNSFLTTRGTGFFGWVSEIAKIEAGSEGNHFGRMHDNSGSTVPSLGFLNLVVLVEVLLLGRGSFDLLLGRR